MKIASICVLAYKRPQLLQESVASLIKTLDYPCEIIINYDGVEMIADIMPEMFIKSSKIIINRGKNRGVGRSFQNCIGVAEGDYIVKADSDIIYEPHWLSKAVKCLEKNLDIGAVGLFDYNKWDRHDERFKPENNIIGYHEDCIIVKDFVSSIYAFRAKDKELIFPVQDDGNHTKLGKLALIDCVNNTAFGVGKSVYVTGTMENPTKTITYDEPLIFTP